MVGDSARWLLVAAFVGVASANFHIPWPGGRPPILPLEQCESYPDPKPDFDIAKVS